jgi:hypothetical protein
LDIIGRDETFSKHGFRVSACPGATRLTQLDYSIMDLNALLSLFI